MFIKKIRIHMINGPEIRRIYLFNRPFIQYYYKDGTKKKKWNFCKYKHPRKDQRVFYLKINRIHQTSYDCIQHWMDAIARLDGFCYFVCDKKAMEYGVFEKPCWFYNDNYAFIPSDRKTLKTTLKKILSKVEREKLWCRIASSMLTPFTHAAKHGFDKIYNIDADDIIILNKPELIAEALKKAELIAENKNIDCFNLDMFVSKSLGVHWSFGVVYIRNPQKCIDTLNKNTDWRTNVVLHNKFKTNYVNQWNFNVDWLFTFMRDTKQLNLQTFYIHNALVVHMPDIAISRHWAFAFQWQAKDIYFPLIDKLYADKIWARLPIYKECIKIDVGLKADSYIEFMNEFYSTTYWFEHNMLDIAKERKLISAKTYKEMMVE